MDRDRVIALVEAEILRRRAIAGINGFNEKAHLDVAEALKIVLETYKNTDEEIISA